MLGNFRGTKFSWTQHLRIFAVLNYSRMQNFKFADLRLDFILALKMAALFVSVVVSPWNGYQYKCKLLQLIFSSCLTDYSQIWSV